MKHKKQALISIMLTAVFLILSSSPVLAADVQAAYAKMPDDLLAEFDKIGNSEAINVFAWIEDESTAEYEAITANIPEPEFAQNNEPSTYSLQSVSANNELTEEERMAQIEEMQNYIMQKRQIAQAVYLEDNTAKAAEIAESLSGGEIVYISKYSPLIIYNVTKSQAVKLAMSDCVLGLDRGNIEGENCSDKARDVIGVSSLEDLGYTGQGIKIGMIEDDVPDESLSCFDGIEDKMYFLNSQLSFQNVMDANHANRVDTHPSLVAAIMVGVDTGVARGFESLYSAYTDNNSEMVINVEKMLDVGVNVINFSWGYNKNCEYNTYTRWIEHVVYQHNVHCVIASGNDGADKVADIGMAYNVITVGAIYDYNTVGTEDDTLYVDDLFYDTVNIGIGDSAYNRTLVSYANKPDICAPGVDIIVNSGTLAFSAPVATTGTSFAAPYVTGSIAMLCSFRPTLLNKPALIKSILCAGVSKKSAHNYSTGDSGYTQYGSGILNMSNVWEILDMINYINYTINSNQKLEYNLGYLAAGKTITVALSYLLSTQTPAGPHSTETIMLAPFSDLDVYLMKTSSTSTTQSVASSTSTNNNVEKFTYQINESGNYKIVVHRKPDSNNGSVRFALSRQIHSDDPQ